MTSDTGKSRATGAIRLTLKGSYTGCKPKQRATLRALGLRKIRGSVVHEDTDAVRGMVETVAHLVELEQLD